MGIKDWLSKFSDDADVDYDEEFEDGMEEEEIPQVTETQKVKPASNSFRPNRAKSTYVPNTGHVQMMIAEPDDYAGVEKLVDALRQLRPVVINFENTNSHDAARIVDFISGAAYALDGKIEKIGKDIFLCVPKNVSLDHNEQQAITELPETMISNWKESN